MSGRVVLITGASSGVGKSIARHLRSRFDHIILVARRFELLQQFFGADPKYSLYQADLAVVEQTIEFLDEVVDRHHFVPYVVNNAAVNVSSSVLDMQTSDLQSALALNAVAPFLILQKLVPAMKERNFGRVVNVTSGAPLNCAPGTGIYSASKAAMNTLTSVLAAELRDTNVKVNLMSPGPVQTEMAPTGPLAPEVCHPTLDYLLELPEDGPSGRFFWLGHEIPLRPDVSKIDWQSGEPGNSLRRAF